MGRRRKKGRPVHGWIILDKPYDYGSTEAVSKLRWLFDAQKAGHAGTLDPLATGILPIAFGEATKTVPYIQDGAKTYQFTAAWGKATTTDDKEGTVIATSDQRPSKKAIEQVLENFIGDIMQTPPAYSAIKIGGERAYDLARDGAAVSLSPRPIRIDALRLVEQPDEDHAVLEAVTGKGAYVRALVRDIARALGTEGHVAALRRTGVGPFSQNNAVTLLELCGDETGKVAREAVDSDRLDGFLVPLEEAMSAYPSVSLTGVEAQKILHGNAVVLAPPVASGIRGPNAGLVPTVTAFYDQQALAICALDGLTLKPGRVFHYD